MFKTTYVYKVTVHILGSHKGLQGCYVKCYLYIKHLKVTKPKLLWYYINCC